MCANGNKRVALRTLQTVFALTISAGAVMSPAAAADFYAGKTIDFVVGFGSGGGYDIYGRTVTRHIVNYIPGKPTIIVKNMPGAGAMKAADYLFNLAPKDGTTFGIISPGSILEPLFNSKDSVRYNPLKLSYIGNANSGTRICFTYHKSKVKTFEDAQKIEVPMGGQTPNDSTASYAQMLNNIAGAKFKIVSGYKSTSDMMLAIERGEIDGICGFDSASFRAQRPAWYKTDQAQIIIQTTITPDPEMVKHGVPSIWKYVTDKNKDIAELIMSQTEFHRPFVAPPDVPADRLEILRKAFDATMKDAGFLADAKKANLDIAPKTGADVAALVTKIYEAPKSVAEDALKAMGR